MGSWPRPIYCGRFRSYPALQTWPGFLWGNLPKSKFREETLPNHLFIAVFPTLLQIRPTFHNFPVDVLVFSDNWAVSLHVSIKISKLEKSHVVLYELRIFKAYSSLRSRIQFVLFIKFGKFFDTKLCLYFFFMRKVESILICAIFSINNLCLCLPNGV